MRIGKRAAMTAYNKTFDLSPEELELIEAALREKQRRLNSTQGCDRSSRLMRGTHDLLGKLHNQKVFYRPRRKGYVSG